MNYLFLQMAKAGFIHTPSDNSPDTATCFFCLKELEGWEPEDEPEYELRSGTITNAFVSLNTLYCVSTLARSL